MYKYTISIDNLFTKEQDRVEKTSIIHMALLSIPSILGIILFMIPLKFGEEWKVPIAKFADILSGWLEPAMPMTAMIIIVIAALGSLLYSFIPRSSSKPSFLEIFVQSDTILGCHSYYRSYFRHHGHVQNRT